MRMGVCDIEIYDGVGVYACMMRGVLCVCACGYVCVWVYMYVY